MLFLTHHIVLVLGFLFAFLLLSHLLTERRAPGSTMAWLLLIVFVPYVGIPLYFMFGGRKMRRLMRSKEALYDPKDTAGTATSHASEQVLVASGAPPASLGNRIAWLGDGEKAYQALVGLIERARHRIDVATFILGNDPVGNDVLERLAKKAEQGVKVRLLLDALGCFRVNREGLKRFRASGGESAFFMPMLHVPFRGRANLRNHRKLVVVDGAAAMVGGMNLAEEYLGPTPLASRWKDLSLTIEGPAVADVSAVFASDWHFASGETLPDTAVPKSSGSAEVQVAGSGPDAENDPIYDAFLSEVFRAEKRIWIATPYYIPDEALSRGLELAARRGIDVRVLVPAESNHWLADQARGPYLRSLERAGGRVLLYEGGMMHAKATLFDDDCAVVASANLDLRSLFLNYEIGVFLYSKGEITELERWFTELAQRAPAGCRSVSHVRELLEGMARLLAPLL